MALHVLRIDLAALRTGLALCAILRPRAQAGPRGTPARCASNSVMMRRAAPTQASARITASCCLAPSATAPAMSSRRLSARRFCWEMVKALTPNNPTDEPDPAPFKVHLLTRAGRLMRARSEPVRAFATKDEAIRFAGRQLGEHYAVYHKDRKIWPAS